MCFYDLCSFLFLGNGGGALAFFSFFLSIFSFSLFFFGVF